MTVVAALVKVDDLKPVQFREKAFRRLVIREDYKRIIKAMVEAYRLEKPGFSDIVSGKGRGLTILLHVSTLSQREGTEEKLMQTIRAHPAQGKRLQQNAWQRNISVLFSPSVAETLVPNQRT